MSVTYKRAPVKLSLPYLTKKMHERAKLTNGGLTPSNTHSILLEKDEYISSPMCSLCLEGTISIGAATNTVNFPPTGSWSTVGTLKLVLNLNGSSNTLKFSNSSAWTPNFDKIDVA